MTSKKGTNGHDHDGDHDGDDGGDDDDDSTVLVSRAKLDDMLGTLKNASSELDFATKPRKKAMTEENKVEGEDMSTSM